MHLAENVGKILTGSAVSLTRIRILPLHANESFDPHCHVYYSNAQTFFRAGSSMSCGNACFFQKRIVV